MAMTHRLGGLALALAALAEVRAASVSASVVPLESLSHTPTGKGPRFSWDTLPVFFHSSNASGPYTADAAKVMARFPMVTIEKFQVRPAACFR